MSKLDIGVGDEFPLDEDNSETRRGRLGRHRHRDFHGHDHGHHQMHAPFRRHHGRHHFHALPLLLILGGVAALVVAGKISAVSAYAMIGLGILFLAVLAFAGARRWRRIRQHIQGEA